MIVVCKKETVQQLTTNCNLESTETEDEVRKVTIHAIPAASE